MYDYVINHFVNDSQKFIFQLYLIHMEHLSIIAGSNYFWWFKLYYLCALQFLNADFSLWSTDQVYTRGSTRGEEPDVKCSLILTSLYNDIHNIWEGTY